MKFRTPFLSFVLAVAIAIITGLITSFTVDDYHTRVYIYIPLFIISLSSGIFLIIIKFLKMVKPTDMEKIVVIVSSDIFLTIFLWINYGFYYIVWIPLGIGLAYLYHWKIED